MTLTEDERAQAYEDAYWAEWAGKESAIERVVTTWDADVVELFEQALHLIDATRDEERDEINEQIGRANG